MTSNPPTSNSTVLSRLRGSGEWLVLLLILAVAALVRFTGLDQGHPYNFHWDEQFYFHEAFYALANGLRRESTVSANLPYLLLPLVLLHWLWLWLAGQVDSFAGLVRSYVENPAAFTLLARTVWAASGVLSVYWVYRVARRVSDPLLSLLAAFFLAGAFLPVAEGHFVKNDVPAGLFLLFLTGCCLSIHERGARGDYFWAGLWFGVATATRYYCAATFLVIILAHFMRRSEPDPGPPGGGPRMTFVGEGIAGLGGTINRDWRQLLFSALGALIGVVATMPVLLLDPGNFWANFSAELGARFPSLPTDGSPQFWFYLTEHLRNGLGYMLLLTGVLGLGIMAFRRIPRQLLFISMPLLVFVTINFLPSNFARYMVPLVPFLYIAAANTLRSVVGQLLSIAKLEIRARSLEWPLLRRIFSTTLLNRVSTLVIWGAALFVSWQSWNQVVRYDQFALAPDTRVAAAAWIEQNIPPGARLVIEGGESFNRASILGPQVWPTVDQLQARGPNSPSEEFYWREVVAAAASHPGYNLRLIGTTVYSPQEIDGRRVQAPVDSVDFWDRPDYFVLISWRSGESLQPGSLVPFWRSLNENYDQVAEFPCNPCFPEDYYAWRISYETLNSITIPASDLSAGPGVRIFKRRSE